MTIEAVAHEAGTPRGLQEAFGAHAVEDMELGVLRVLTYDGPTVWAGGTESGPLGGDLGGGLDAALELIHEEGVGLWGRRVVVEGLLVGGSEGVLVVAFGDEEILAEVNVIGLGHVDLEV